MSWTQPPVTPGPPARYGTAAIRRARLRRRTWWLLGTAPLVLALVVVGLRLTFLAPTAAGARDDYDAGDAVGARTTYDAQKILNLVDPWKAHYNAGTAGAQTEDAWELYDAISSLSTAYDLANGESPEVRCQIQTNLSVAYELSGDDSASYADAQALELEAVEEAVAARDAGEDYDELVLDPDGDGTDVDVDELRDTMNSYYQYAQRDYATAEQVRGWPDCEDSEQTPEQQEQSEAAVQRLQDKQQAAEDSQSEEGGSEGSEDESDEGEGSEGSDGSEDETEGGDESEGKSQAELEEEQRQQELEEQDSAARDEQDQLEQEYRDLYGDESGGGGGSEDGGGSTKNW
ncbi:hypothetical protein IF650_06430 [Cellulosimicrobium terreum]|nr:hypothetical protein [Cellulosimicrobium terreum]